MLFPVCVTALRLLDKNLIDCHFAALHRFCAMKVVVITCKRFLGSKDHVCFNTAYFAYPQTEAKVQKANFK